MLAEGGYIARWGGDEFALIVPCTDESGMLLLQNRLQRSIHGWTSTKINPVIRRNASSIHSFSFIPRKGSPLIIPHSPILYLTRKNRPQRRSSLSP
ncbi:hypothetical protein [Paenibacillus apiarius]|uniref:hypothetical protein n=1 Tax=Paenibacillus apiarius TaxID=46240 RepID=UPI003B3B35C6